MTLLPYIAGAVLAAFVGGYITGCSEEREHFESFKAVTKAVGEAQEARTKAWIVEGKRNKEKADADYDRVVGGLLTELERTERRLRVATAGSGIVPPARPVAEGGDGDTVCFSQKVLDSGVRSVLERFLGRATGSVRESEKVLAAFQTCAAWAVKNADRSN